MSYREHQHLEGYGVGFADGRDHGLTAWHAGVVFGVLLCMTIEAAIFVVAAIVTTLNVVQ